MRDIKRVFNEEVSAVEKEFNQYPFKFLSERTLVAALYSRLLKKYDHIINLKSNTVDEVLGQTELRKGTRVHLEANTKALQNQKRQKVDILVIDNNDAELHGHCYTKGNPSSRFEDEKVLMAIEVKFYRRFHCGEYEKPFREAEKRNFKDTIDKLKLIKDKNDKALCAIVIFSNAHVSGSYFNDVKSQAKKSKLLWYPVFRKMERL